MCCVKEKPRHGLILALIRLFEFSMNRRLMTASEQFPIMLSSELLFPYILILPMHHYLPCYDSEYVRADHEQPHDEDEYTHDTAHPLDALTFQLISYIDCADGKSSVREDHRPPAVISIRATYHWISETSYNETNQVKVNFIFRAPCSVLIKAMQNHQNPIIQMKIAVNRAMALSAVAAPGCAAK
jgi:hypothetical protein